MGIVVQGGCGRRLILLDNLLYCSRRQEFRQPTKPEVSHRMERNLTVIGREERLKRGANKGGNEDGISFDI